MHRICFTSCAYGMFLPTGSTPALPRDESKLHTTHTADAAWWALEPTRHRAGTGETAYHRWGLGPGPRDTLSE